MKEGVAVPTVTYSRIGILVFLFLLVLVPSGGVSAQEGKRIPCFVMGQVVHAPYVPFTVLFMQDPLFRYALYPSLFPRYKFIAVTKNTRFTLIINFSEFNFYPHAYL